MKWAIFYEVKQTAIGCDTSFNVNIKLKSLVNGVLHNTHQILQVIRGGGVHTEINMSKISDWPFVLYFH